MWFKGSMKKFVHHVWKTSASLQTMHIPERRYVLILLMAHRLLYPLNETMTRTTHRWSDRSCSMHAGNYRIVSLPSRDNLSVYSNMSRDRFATLSVVVPNKLSSGCPLVFFSPMVISISSLCKWFPAHCLKTIILMMLICCKAWILPLWVKEGRMKGRKRENRLWVPFWFELKISIKLLTCHMYSFLFFVNNIVLVTH